VLFGAGATAVAQTPALQQRVCFFDIRMPGLSGLDAAQAVDYLVTPVDTPRLDRVQARAGNLVHLVPINEVIYLEAADKHLRVVTAERGHLIRLLLRELLPQLDPPVFWQVQRGTVAQARCVSAARRGAARRIRQGHADAGKAA
jgi:hypothetical protein